MTHDDHYDNPDHQQDAEGVEAYCMTCRATTPMDNPEAIWTRRGQPGTRGVCSVCGTTVFRMGKTPAHEHLKRPEPIHVAEGPARGKVDMPSTYVAYSVSDAAFAESLADDLERIGIPTWLSGTESDDVQWATGVHPALVECKNMIVVLTPLAVQATNVNEAWAFFVKQRKPVVVVLLDRAAEVPDELRRKPRFDFSGDDYKAAFRALTQELTR